LLIPAALAVTLPVQATWKERVEPGGLASVSATTTGTLSAVHPTTGAPLALSADELTVRQRFASGDGAPSFRGDPKSSVRTWALTPLDRDGRPVGEPQIVEVVFDEAGLGALRGRDGAPWLSTLRVGDGGSWTEVDGVRFGGDLRVALQDGGASASWSSAPTTPRRRWPSTPTSA
jgi:hypothetical protein